MRESRSLRRVDAPTPLLLRSPALAKVQSHSHHLLRQVLLPYLAVSPRLEELVSIAALHHSLPPALRRVEPLPPLPRLSVGKVGLGVILGSRRRPRRSSSLCKKARSRRCCARAFSKCVRGHIRGAGCRRRRPGAARRRSRRGRDRLCLVLGGQGRAPPLGSAAGAGCAAAGRQLWDSVPRGARARRRVSARGARGRNGWVVGLQGRSILSQGARLPVGAAYRPSHTFGTQKKWYISRGHGNPAMVVSSRCSLARAEGMAAEEASARLPGLPQTASRAD